MAPHRRLKRIRKRLAADHDSENDLHSTDSSSHRSSSVPKSGLLPQPATSSFRWQWSFEEECILLEFITKNKKFMGEDGNFREAFWNDMAHRLLPPTSGGEKTASSCKGKWHRMRSTFTIVDQIANNPGITYSLEKGADIGTENQHLWDGIMKNINGASKFRNKGWTHYERMKSLMSPQSKANDMVESSRHSRPSSSGMIASTSRDVEMAQADPPQPNQSSNSSLVVPAPLPPPSAPSHAGSAFSSVSSVPVRAGRPNKRRAVDESSSMVSTTPEETIGLQGDVKALQDMLRAHMELMKRPIEAPQSRPSIPSPTGNYMYDRREFARMKLLELEQTTLSPEGIVTMFDVFGKNNDHVDAYIVLATSDVDAYNVRRAWLEKRIAEVHQ